MTAKEISPELRKSVIYQMFLRMFTHEGTISAATEMLESVKEIGVDILYLCPFVQADTDSANLSPRQIASKIGNPKNPYRIKDYFKIDEEYGTDEDMEAFVKKAHSLGMKVLFDLVYVHCGPTAKLAYTDLIKRDKDGNAIFNDYNFPELDYSNPELCDLMYSNMEYFVKKFNVDGFRMDVGDGVPLFFWESSLERLRKINPDLIAINEGDNPASLVKAFDLNYGIRWGDSVQSVFINGESALNFKNVWTQYNREIDSFHSLRAFENHDYVNECYETRNEKAIGSDGVEAIFVLNFTADGVPLIYNGNEVCDTARHSIYSNRFYGRMCIDWRKALTSEGKHRREFLKALSDLKKSESALWNGTLDWIDNTNPEKIISFVRCDGEKILVVINTSNTHQSCETQAFTTKSVLLQKGASFTENCGKTVFELEPYGYAVIKG